MGSTNWTALSGAASASVVIGTTDNGPYGVPNGGGVFTRGIGRVAAGADGFVGEYINNAPWTPTPKGASVACAICRAGKGTDLDANLVYSPCIFANLQGAAVGDLGYILGFTQEEPARLALRKGVLSAGMNPEDSGILRLSSGTYPKGTWVHIKLDVIEQPSGDVLLQVFESNLGANLVSGPSWESVVGMADFTDDVTAYATGSVPLQTGRAGLGMRMGTESGRYSYFDHFEAFQDIT